MRDDSPRLHHEDLDAWKGTPSALVAVDVAVDVSVAVAVTIEGTEGLYEPWRVSARPLRALSRQ